MSDITVEQKLQLIQQIRSEHSRNQYDMQNREQILYGKSSLGNAYSSPYIGNARSGVYGLSDADTPIKISTFKIRLGLALVLLCIIIFLDVRQNSLWGLNTSKIFTYISKDIEIDTSDVMEELSQTFME